MSTTTAATFVPTAIPPAPPAPPAAAGGGAMIDAGMLKRWLAEGSAVVVDVREPEEFAREHIEGAYLVPLSRFDSAQVPAGAKLVLHCKSGRRSAEAAARLAAAGRVDVLQLHGGLEAWKAAGLPLVENPRVPISIMRQVQIVVGGAVLGTSILAAAVSPWFLALTGFFGAGLLFAGTTGMCGMATMLAAMPWNRAFRATGSAPSRGRSCSGGSCCS